MAKRVDISFLGGVGEIGKNMTVIEYGDDMIIVDCGASFATEDNPGIDAIIPDITYVKKNRKKLKGIVLTHGHEDHIGAIPYYLDVLNVPIYGTALTLGLLERKLEYDGHKADLRVVKPHDKVKLGCFEVEFIKVDHSMAGACALAINTPSGMIFVTGDYKFDNSPIDNKKTDIQRIAEIGAKGVALMLGESTNVERKGNSTSEKEVGKHLEDVFRENKNKRIIIATFASSNYRVQQVLWLAKKYNRKVLLCGKSMKGMVEVAKEVKELEISRGLIVDKIGKLHPEELVVLATGSQGEKMSALEMMSRGTFNDVNVGPDDLVVFSSSPIPGNEKPIYQVINNLFKRGANVIYDSMNEMHASGHAYEEELKMMFNLVHPRNFMPVHGEYRHQIKHAQLINSLGLKKKNIFIPEIGNTFSLTKKGVKLVSGVPHGIAYVDGVLLEDGNSVVNDRRSLAEFGMLIILADVDEGGKVLDLDVMTRGLSLSDEFEEKIRTVAFNTIQGSSEMDLSLKAKECKYAIRKVFMKERQYPIIIPVIIED